jgi:hypothetical protein
MGLIVGELFRKARILPQSALRTACRAQQSAFRV